MAWYRRSSPEFEEYGGGYVGRRRRIVGSLGAYYLGFLGALRGGFGKVYIEVHRTDFVNRTAWIRVVNGSEFFRTENALEVEGGDVTADVMGGAHLAVRERGEAGVGLELGCCRARARERGSGLGPFARFLSFFFCFFLLFNFFCKLL